MHSSRYWASMRPEWASVMARAQACIAAISGLMPTMFMTRVRL